MSGDKEFQRLAGKITYGSSRKMGSERDKNMAFEADVRRVAEAVWGLVPGACQPMHYADDPTVRELDGLARTRDVTHLLMVTTSTRLDKVKDDCKKLNAAENLEKLRATAISKWIITEKQLDAQHIEHARKTMFARSRLPISSADFLIPQNT